jgi:hypothetical protein
VSKFGTVWRALRTIWRFLVGVSCVSSILNGVNLVRLRSICPTVRLADTPQVLFLVCVKQNAAETSDGWPIGSIAALMIFPSSVILLWVSRHFLADMWWRNRPGTPLYTVTRTFDLPPARVPVVVPGASPVCPWCAEAVDAADLVCRSCNGALPQLRGTVPPPADEWATLRAAHPHAVGPVLHSAEQIPKDQWPVDVHSAIDRACALFTTEGLDANKAVQRAFAEADPGIAPVAEGTDAELPDRGDDPPAPSLTPRLPPR